jgi:CheY-like chemotaxis protein
MHRLLVVDNNHDYADSVCELLRMTSDWDIDVAYGSADALSQALAHPPDVVMIDLEMPGMNGFGTADRLREAMREPLPRLVAVTGNSNLQMEALHDARFADALLKPADANDMLDVMTRFADAPPS